MGCRLCSPTAPGRCLHFECRGAPARVRAWRCEGRPPLPHHFVCVETFTLPYLTWFTHTKRVLLNVCVSRLAGGERKGGTSSQEHHSWSAATTTQSAASSAGQ